MPADSTWAEGDVLTYNSPDWGRCTGTVLCVNDCGTLVQDHHEHGAREWVQPAWVVSVAPQPAEVPDAG